MDFLIIFIFNLKTNIFHNFILKMIDLDCSYFLFDQNLLVVSMITIKIIAIIIIYFIIMINLLLKM
jgi:hypothetical protein